VNNSRIVTYIQNKIETRVYLELVGNTNVFVDITFTFKMSNKSMLPGISRGRTINQCTTTVRASCPSTATKMACTSEATIRSNYCPI